MAVSPGQTSGLHASGELRIVSSRPMHFMVHGGEHGVRGESFLDPLLAEALLHGETAAQSWSLAVHSFERIEAMTLWTTKTLKTTLSVLTTPSPAEIADWVRKRLRAREDIRVAGADWGDDGVWVSCEYVYSDETEDAIYEALEAADRKFGLDGRIHLAANYLDGGRG